MSPGDQQQDDTLALTVVRVLMTAKSTDEAASELFDLLGDGIFEEIQALLQQRYEDKQ